MVNRGPSNGCITCRQRRVKCDEAKPRCQQCHRLGRHCGGYGKKPPPVRFKDETSRFVARSSSPGDMKLETSTMTTTTTSPVSSKMTVSTTISPRSRSGSPHSCTVHYSPSPNQQDLALSFFLTYVADLGRGNQSSRGFIEIVRPALATERHDSALFTAVHAVSMRIWAHLQFRVAAKPQQPVQLFTRALERLQTAVSDTKEREQDGTVLAALTLQLYDTYSAVLNQNRPLGTHLDGAWALLSQRKGSPMRSKFHGRLLSHLLHTKVSMCIREKKAFDAEEIEWLERDVIPVLPSNPSAVLDVIGVSVANIQSAHAAEKEDISSSHLEDWFQRVQTVEAQLDSWLQVVPPHWHPTTAHVGKDIKSSIITYEDTCDIYPNIQIASLWNVWRIYRLILVEIKLQLAKDLPVDDGNTFSARTTDSTQLHRVAQKIFDDICYSVPFYLGNRVSPTSLSGMGSLDCIYPSYHHLRCGHTEAFQLYEGSDSYLSEVDHGRHATIQGPWRIMNILAYLAGLLTEGQSLMASQALRIRQRNWILEQFLRSLHVQRLASPCISPQRKHSRDDLNGQGDAFEAPHAEHLASKVRDGLWIMNIL